MRVLISTIMMAAACLMVSVLTVTAAPLEYTITGTGSGIFDHRRFADLAYTITLEADSRTYAPLDGGFVLDPLTSASIALQGLGTFTFTRATRLGVGTVGGIYFSRSGGMSVHIEDFLDMLDFNPPQPVDLLTAFGPVTSTAVYDLYQFVDVPTSGGALTLSSSSNVAFTSLLAVAPVPLPRAAPLFGSAVLLLGLNRLRRRDRVRTRPAH